MCSSADFSSVFTFPLFLFFITIKNLHWFWADPFVPTAILGEAIFHFLFLRYLALCHVSCYMCIPVIAFKRHIRRMDSKRDRKGVERFIFVTDDGFLTSIPACFPLLCEARVFFSPSSSWLHPIPSAFRVVRVTSRMSMTSHVHGQIMWTG